MIPELHFDHVRLSPGPRATLFEAAEAAGISVPTSCRKQGKCRECLVEVVEGMDRLSPREPAEAHLRDRFRLSCCARLLETPGIVRCHTLRRGGMRVERRAVGITAGAEAGKADWRDPAVTREGDRVLLDSEAIGRWSGPLHGLAMDLGTTTVVLRLLDLESGETIADSAFENPQRFGGSDIMARIRYDHEDGTRVLQRTLLECLSRAVLDFGVEPESIFEMVVAGNSTMRDLLFGLSVQSIGQSPYQSVTEMELAAGIRRTTSLVEKPGRLRLPMHPRGRVSGLPIISGHVGADAAACMLALDLAREPRLVAVMDIGTNTELILGNRERILAASCPAGPAFEGGRIGCGMAGLPGAIEGVTARADGTFDLRVIGGGEPEGICGSGLVDMLGELLRTGRMNVLGRLESGEDRVVFWENNGTRVWLSEADINELAQAKGAHAAGLRILFDAYGASLDELHRLYLAGGFGRYLNVEAAQRIGLIPAIDAAKVVQVGNASIEGASIALLSRRKRAELEDLVRRVEHCRLETHPGFFDFFVDGCQFRP